MGGVCLSFMTVTAINIRNASRENLTHYYYNNDNNNNSSDIFVCLHMFYISQWHFCYFMLLFAAIACLSNVQRPPPGGVSLQFALLIVR